VPGLPQSTVARHVATRRDLGLIQATRDGQRVLLRMEGPAAGDLMAAVCEWVHPETRERLRREYPALAGGSRG
jgi:hypothetical protein